jgi:plastocyanin
MKSIRYSLIMMVLLSLSSFSVNTVDSKEKAEAGSAPSAKHGTWQEKRFVVPVDYDGVQRVEIAGGEYFFDPNYIVVKVNKPVEFKVKKTARYIPHALVAKAPEAGIDFTVELNNDPQAVSFTPTKTGKYPIYCDKKMFWFKTHRERGMEGLIEVVK